MPSVGDATYTTRLVVEGDAQYAAAMNRAAAANRAYEASSMRLGAANRPTPVFGPEPEAAEGIAGTQALLGRIAAAPTRGPRLTPDAARRQIGQVQQRLRRTVDRMAQAEATRGVSYPEELVSRVQTMRGEFDAAQGALGANLGPSGKVVRARFSNALGGATDEANGLVEEVGRYTQAYRAGIVVEDRLQKAKSLQQRAVEQAARSSVTQRLGTALRRAPGVGRTAGMLEALGLAPELLVGLSGAIAATGMVATIVDQVMQYNRGNLAVGSVIGNGSTGATLGSGDVGAANYLRQVAFQYRIPADQTIAAATGAAGQYNLRGGANLEAATAMGEAQAQLAGLSPQQGIDLATQLLARTGGDAQQAQQQLARFNDAVTATGASSRSATEDLAAFLPVVGASGIPGVAGLSLWASQYGLTASQMSGNVLTATGGRRIALASILGFSPDQFAQMQQSTQGQTQITQAEGKYLAQLQQQLGLTGAETVAQTLGIVPQGANADKVMQALLATQQGIAFSGVMLQAQQAAQATPNVGAQQAAAAAARQQSAGVPATIGTGFSLFGTSLAEALTGTGPVSPNGPGGFFGSLVGDIAANALGPGRFPTAAAQTAAVGPGQNWRGQLDITIRDPQGRPIGQATQIIGPGVPQQPPNTETVAGPQPGGGGGYPVGR